MEHSISIYDLVNKTSHSFEKISDATKFLKVETRNLYDLRRGRSEHINDRFILNENKNLLTTVRDLSTGEIYEILNVRTLGLILNFSASKKDAAALCLIKGSRANYATIAGRKFENINSDKGKTEAFLEKWAKAADKQRIKDYREKTFQKRSERKKKWNKENKEKVRIYNNEYTTSRRKRDISFRMRMNLRSRIKLAMKGETKRGSILSLIGCTMDFLKKYLEDQFDKFMSWENYGSLWTIDHIIPCAFFDLSIEDHQRMCCYYKNLRPLGKLENEKKLNKLPDDYRSFISDNLIETALYPVTAYKLMLGGHANL